MSASPDRPSPLLMPRKRPEPTPPAPAHRIFATANSDEVLYECKCGRFFEHDGEAADRHLRRALNTGPS